MRQEERDTQLLGDGDALTRLHTPADTPEKIFSPVKYTHTHTQKKKNIVIHLLSVLPLYFITCRIVRSMQRQEVQCRRGMKVPFQGYLKQRRVPEETINSLETHLLTHTHTHTHFINFETPSVTHLHTHTHTHIYLFI